jgi:hypothetical protein
LNLLHTFPATWCSLLCFNKASPSSASCILRYFQTFIFLLVRVRPSVRKYLPYFPTHCRKSVCVIQRAQWWTWYHRGCKEQLSMLFVCQRWDIRSRGLRPLTESDTYEEKSELFLYWSKVSLLEAWCKTTPHSPAQTSQTTVTPRPVRKN